MSFSLLKPDSEGDKSKTGNAAGLKASIFGGEKLPAEESDDSPFLTTPLQSTFAHSSDTISVTSTYPADNANERRLGRECGSDGSRISSISPPPTRTYKSWCHAFWGRNKGMVLVMVSQFFGALMNAFTRMLETEQNGHGMHTLQILFARMGITVVLSSAYMWWAHVEHFPFGNKEVRTLLFLRGFGGFFGVWGLYYALQYLPLAEATVITFLAPIVACWVCSIFLHEPFTRKEQFAGVISLIGVILIARPLSFFPNHSSSTPVVGSGAGDGVPLLNATTPAEVGGLIHVTPAQRLGAVGASILGVFGAATAYTSIRWIGKRAHPLISVNYFAAWTTLVSMVALLVIPNISFKLPSNPREWGLLLFLGICGFAMQLLLTAGLQHERSSRATNMVYTQMLFAIAFDKIMWNTTPSILSLIGSSLILGSALYVAIQNNQPKAGMKVAEGREDEETGLLTGEREGNGERTPQRSPRGAAADHENLKR